ncbi:DoxX family protein [Terrimonas alba]|uniref:DoxX family protein n=1 Tax=Terrimonas alba TaxID=3349636 RepID=UPI0035F3950A
MKRLFSIKYTDNGIAFATFLLRLALGGLIIPHGYSKLITFASKSSSFADPFHIGHSTSMALVIFAEFFCGVFILLGLFTRLACIPLIVTMAVALFYAHKGDFFGQGETATLYLMGYLALLFTGPGKISLDRFIAK